MESRGSSCGSVRYNAHRDNILTVDQKIDRVTGRIENMNRRMDGVPRRVENVEQDYDARKSEMDRLQQGQRLQDLKLELLEKEMGYMKLSNEMILERMRDSDNNENTGGYMENEAPGEQTNRSNDFNRLDLSEDIANVQTQRYTPSPHKSTAQSERRLTSSDRRDMEEDRIEKERLRLSEKYGIHDSTALNPQNWKVQSKEKPLYMQENLPEAGGLVFLRFDDENYGEVKVHLRSPQQAICRHAGGYILGVSRRDRICVFEDAPRSDRNWTFPCIQQGENHMKTRNAIVAFWFARRKSAEEFFENGHKNHLRSSMWPSPNGHDAVFLPLNEFPPTNPNLKTFFVVEFLEAKRFYSPGDMTQFESDVREAMLSEVPGCIPLAVASIEGKVIFVPSPFISPYSKVYVSRFESQKDAEKIWNMGIIQGLRQKWGMTGPINVFCFTIDDMV